VASFYEVLCGEPPRHLVVLHYLAGDNAGLVSSDKYRRLAWSLTANESEEVGSLRVGNYQPIAMPMQGYYFIEEVPSLKVPSRGTGVLADDPDCAGIIPTERDENAALECYLVRGRLHVLSDRLHERALVGNTHVDHTRP
jgi:hypothetical protein